MPCGRNVDFGGEEKTGVPGEKPLGEGKRTNKLSPHETPDRIIEPRPHWYEASALTTTPSLLPLLVWGECSHHYVIPAPLIDMRRVLSPLRHPCSPYWYEASALTTTSSLIPLLVWGECSHHYVIPDPLFGMRRVLSPLRHPCSPYWYEASALTTTPSLLPLFVIF